MRLRCLLSILVLLILLPMTVSAQFRSRGGSLPAMSQTQTYDPYGGRYENNFDPTAEDSDEEIPVEKKKRVIDTTYFHHSPTKAMIYSLVVPGLGQAYNKKYWKIPIVAGALGGCIAYLRYADKTYSDYRKGYVSYMDKDPNTNFFKTLPLSGLDENGNVVNASRVKSELESVKSQFDRYRSLAMIGTILIYALNVIDATVDAHLFNFDVNEDISLNIQPDITPNMYSQNLQYGLSLNFNLK